MKPIRRDPTRPPTIDERKRENRLQSPLSPFGSRRGPMRNAPGNEGGRGRSAAEIQAILEELACLPRNQLEELRVRDKDPLPQEMYEGVLAIRDRRPLVPISGYLDLFTLDTDKQLKILATFTPQMLDKLVSEGHIDRGTMDDIEKLGKQSTEEPVKPKFSMRVGPRAISAAVIGMFTTVFGLDFVIRTLYDHEKGPVKAVVDSAKFVGEDIQKHGVAVGIAAPVAGLLVLHYARSIVDVWKRPKDEMGIYEKVKTTILNVGYGVCTTLATYGVIAAVPKFITDLPKVFNNVADIEPWYNRLMPVINGISDIAPLAAFSAVGLLGVWIVDRFAFRIVDKLFDIFKGGWTWLWIGDENKPGALRRAGRAILGKIGSAARNRAERRRQRAARAAAQATSQDEDEDNGGSGTSGTSDPGAAGGDPTGGNTAHGMGTLPLYQTGDEDEEENLN